MDQDVRFSFRIQMNLVIAVSYAGEHARCRTESHHLGSRENADGFENERK